jgi:hypothetical protein
MSDKICPRGLFILNDDGTIEETQDFTLWVKLAAEKRVLKFEEIKPGIFISTAFFGMSETLDDKNLFGTLIFQRDPWNTLEDEMLYDTQADALAGHVALKKSFLRSRRFKIQSFCDTMQVTLASVVLYRRIIMASKRTGNFGLAKQVANQMMKGPKPGSLVATRAQQDAFYKRHEKQILWAIYHLPICSAAIKAVIVKCLIKYDPRKVAELCWALKNMNFRGTNDPAYLLWRTIQKQQTKDTVLLHRKAICAAKAYCEGRTLKALQEVIGDVFEWDEDFTVPDEFLSKWNPNQLPEEIGDSKTNLPLPTLQDRQVTKNVTSLFETVSFSVGMGQDET